MNDPDNAPALVALPEPADGPHDAALREAQSQVERAERVLSNARDARSRAMAKAQEDGYSIYLLGVLTGRRKPTSVHRDLRRIDPERGE